MKNTLKISIYSILVGFPLPIVLAIICNQIRVGKFKKNFSSNDLFTSFYLDHGHVWDDYSLSLPQVVDC